MSAVPEEASRQRRLAAWHHHQVVRTALLAALAVAFTLVMTLAPV